MATAIIAVFGTGCATTTASDTPVGQFKLESRNYSATQSGLRNRGSGAARAVPGARTDGVTTCTYVNDVTGETQTKTLRGNFPCTQLL
ncbi:MAG: hypothetical protein AAGA84_11120 [Pseudomonadota bacterium]